MLGPMAKKNAAAVELGRLGGQAKVPKGFSVTDAAAAGKKGAANRWGKKRPAGKRAAAKKSEK